MLRLIKLNTQPMTTCAAMMCFILMTQNSNACTEMPKLNANESKVSNVTFQRKGEQKKWCLKLSGEKSGLIEWNSVNKSNAQCGVLKMVVHLPDGSKLKSEGPQPGVAAIYQPGKYVMSYTMKTNEPNCRTWDLSARYP